MSATPLGIVLIEDDEVDVEVISRSLLSFALPPHLTVFGTGGEALHVLQGQQSNRPPHPFLILLDLSLPGMMALEFLGHIRRDKDFRGTVVFALTEPYSRSEMATAYDLAIAGYIPKSCLGDKCEPLVNLVRMYMRYVHFPS